MNSDKYYSQRKSNANKKGIPNPKAGEMNLNKSPRRQSYLGQNQINNNMQKNLIKLNGIGGSQNGEEVIPPKNDNSNKSESNDEEHRNTEESPSSKLRQGQKSSSQSVGGTQT